MTKKSLTRSTAMALCLALAAPTPGFTQNDISSAIQSGGTVDASEIDALERAELVRLSQALGVGGDNPETLGTDELRKEVKDHLGIATDDGASEEADEGAPEGVAADETTAKEGDKASVDNAPVEEAAEAPADEAPAEEVAEAPADEAPVEDAAKAQAAETPVEEAAEAPADEAPVEEAAETPADDAPAEEAAEAPADEAPVEDAAKAQAAETPVEEAAEAPADEAPVEEAAETPADDAPAEEAAEAPADEAPVEDAAKAQAAETPVEEAAETPADDAPAEEAAEAPADEAPEEEAAEAPTDEAPAEEAAEPQADEESAEAVADATTENGSTDNTSDTSAKPQSGGGGAASASTEQPVQDAADAPAPLAAADDAAAEQGEVVTETVTEDDVRSSAEEFETDVIVEADETREREDDDNDDDNRGLSNAETAAAIGLGVLALSQILGGNDEVVSNSGDRVVIRRDGELQVLKDDDVLLRRPGAQVETRRFDDGSTRAVVTRPDGTQIITVRAADGTVIRRVQVRPDGSRVVLIDDTEADLEPVNVTELPEPAREPGIATSRDREALEAALNAQLSANVDRRFSLRQVRNIREVRHLMPEVTLDAINFRTGSAVIQPGEAEELADLGSQMADFVAENPDEVFLVEGHTDTVGGAAYNLALSDRRAESVALALVEYFDVPPENLVIQGYGESDLLVNREGDVRANRRATVRRITPLLQTARSN